MIKGQKVDVGKAVITKPLELMFHGQPIPSGNFRVTLSSVKSGHEDFPLLGNAVFQTIYLRSCKIHLGDA